MADKKTEKKTEKKYFTIDQDKHVITVDTTVKPQKSDEDAVALYVKMGYAMRIKSQVRAKAMKEKADNLTAEQIRTALADDKANLDKFEAILTGKDPDNKKGFFAAKKWYKANFLSKKK